MVRMRGRRESIVGLERSASVSNYKIKNMIDWLPMRVGKGTCCLRLAKSRRVRNCLVWGLATMARLARCKSFSQSPAIGNSWENSRRNI